MVLQVFGVIFLAIICVAAYFVWKFYRLSKKQSSSDISLAMSVLPSMAMELEPSSIKEWKEVERLARIESELKKVGAEHVGYYCVYSGYAIIRISLWDFKSQAVVAIYEAFSELDTDNVNFIYEASCKVKGGSVCVTSNQNAVFESRPLGHKIVFNQSASIVDFLKHIKSELPAGTKIQRIEDAKSFFIACYEDISEWGWRPEQIRSSKTLQVLSSVGVKIDEDLLYELEEMGNNYSVDVNISRARRSLAKHSKMSAEQWERVRDQFVFINEYMTVEHLIGAVYDIAGELTAIQEQVLDGFQARTVSLVDPIGAFQMLIQSMNLKVKRIASLSAPIKTEVYLPISNKSIKSA